MKHNFIVDQEIDLNQNDFLKTKTYSDNLTKIIKNTEPNNVFTIGLFGSWGTGKSSIVKTSEEDFDSKKIKFITYDAWQYVNDSFRRMFLSKLRDGLLYEVTDLMRRFYENESTEVKNKYQLSSKGVSIILIALVVLIVILQFLPFDIEYKLSIVSIITLVGLLITIISGAFHQLKISVTKPHLFAPEQFEECFKEIVTHSLSKSNAPNKVMKWVRGDKSIQNLEKLVIVIDNIDRCSNEVAYNLLTDIKTFLSSLSLSIIFVIPVDDDALKNHLIKTSGNLDCDREKEEFLRKFFNVTIRIKPYGESDMYSFAKQICDKYKLDFKPETINVASKEYAKNPRRVIQLFNNLLAEINYYDASFVQKNETLICCLLIIREEYSEYYKQLVNSPKLLNEEYSGNQDVDGVKRFVRIAHTALGRVRSSDISIILTNTHRQFDDIEEDLKDAIDTYDVDKVLKVWSPDINLFNYIYHKMDYSIKNKLIESDLVGYVDLLTHINSIHPFDVSNAKRIDENISDYISSIILKTKSHINLCNYALLRSGQNDNKIKSTLISESKRLENDEKGVHWEELFNGVLNVFNDGSTSKLLASTYTLYYDSVEDIEFSKEQIEHLISNEFVENRIRDLNPNKEKEISLDVSTEEYKYVKWLFENKKNISAGTYAVLFAEIIGKDSDDLRLIDKTNEDIVDILNFLNPLLQLIPNSKLTVKPQTLYSLIVNDRNIPHPSYPNHRNYDQRKNFIDECIEGEKYISEIIEFVFNIYRITNNNTSINNEIKKIINYTYLDNELVKLIDMGYTLKPLLDIVFDAEERFDNNARLKVLQHCLNQKNSSGDYSIEKTKAERKLNEMLTYAQQKTNTEVFELLDLLSKQERYEKIISNLIIEKDSMFINSLPGYLLKLAINSFSDENFREYAGNAEFLSVIIQKGNVKQKSNLVKILIDKLNSNTDINTTLGLISKMDNIPTFDEVGLLHAHLNAYQKDNRKSLTDEEFKMISKLKRKAKL